MKILISVSQPVCRGTLVCRQRAWGMHEKNSQNFKFIWKLIKNCNQNQYKYATVPSIKKGCETLISSCTRFKVLFIFKRSYFNFIKLLNMFLRFKKLFYQKRLRTTAVNILPSSTCEHSSPVPYMFSQIFTLYILPHLHISLLILVETISKTTQSYLK